MFSVDWPAIKQNVVNRGAAKEDKWFCLHNSCAVRVAQNRDSANLKKITFKTNISKDTRIVLKNKITISVKNC